MTTENQDILIVDDEESTARFIAGLVKAHGYNPTVVHSVNDAISLLQEKYFPIVLSDLCLGPHQGLELIPYIKKSPKPSLITFITSFGSIDTVVEAIREGAFDYLSKPDDLNDLEAELLPLLERARLHINSLLKGGPVPEPLKEQIQGGIIGHSPKMIRIYRLIAKASLSRGNVLVLGESGTGKELVAHAIHAHSPRKDRPFITVNCCALTETLLESELFGHVKGSFTGAAGNKRGLFEEADGGTLFLDEIGDVSHTMQVKLLRAIQYGEVKPVGASETRKVDVRVVAATHRNLDEFVKEGKFREDLYYRLKVFLLELPALRERTEDIPDLVHHFLHKIAQKNAQSPKQLAKHTMETLVGYSWPGNIRELENALERAIGMSTGPFLFPEDFPSEVLGEDVGEVAHPEAEVGAPEFSTQQVKSLLEMEIEHIRYTLQAVKFNKKKAAELLGIDRGTLYRKAADFGISLHAPKTEATPESH